MSASTPKWNPRGSEWHRWDPHIHTPGTINNDQFKGDWSGYIKALNEASPVIRAVGVTDYYSLDTYREMRRREAAGELPNVAFLFPNVELRLDVKTAKGKAINLHLLFSPEDANHEQEIERILGLLQFEYAEKNYQCATDDLMALGRKFDPKQTDPKGAYREGAKQFKVTYRDLRDLLRREKWLRENCLVAVAAGANDGTSGLQTDDAFAATREEIQRLAHIVFSGNSGDQEFWLGKKSAAPREALERMYGGLKPCLHGSDAHQISDVGQPKENRYCWIKGDLAFETLRQTVIEPAERVSIGELAPPAPGPSVTLDTIRPANMPWLKNAKLPMNGGLVAVIGARGSGKTALVDMIAAGAGALVYPLSESSFLRRATSPIDLLDGAQVNELWCDGASAEVPFAPPPEYDFSTDAPRVCYLSQQFVDRLCSSGGLAVELREEIERVIFDQTEKTERYDTTTFAALSKVLLDPIRHRRRQYASSITSLSAKIATEQRMIDQLPTLRTNRKTLADTLTKQKGDLAKLVPKGKEERAKRLASVEAACTATEGKIETLNKRRNSLGNLLAEAEVVRTQTEPERFADMQERFADTALTPAEWENFRLRFFGPVETVVANAKTQVANQIKVIEDGDPENPVDRATAPFSDWPLAHLRTERDKLKKEVGIDATLQKQYNTLKKAIDDNDTALKKADGVIKNAEGADERRKTLIQSRRDAYRDVMRTLTEERTVLEGLYEPLHRELGGAKGALGRLRFGVRRVVNLDRWVQAGEALLDLRKTSTFQGHGKLASEAAKKLVGPWRTGDAEQIATAMHEFVAEQFKEMVRAMPTSDAAQGPVEWRRKVGDWLYSSDHITIEYGLQFDGTNVEQLSPGTRGIVLLLLYLAIDRHDLRPLLIDQPEENLDPKSVFEDLVPHFREARHRRQVVIVTHNANLVVNTDADQVIVATSTPGAEGGLPDITYETGSLENPRIRHAVCDILEGGERAFLERERRYRLQWEQMLEDSPPPIAPMPEVSAPATMTLHFAYGSNLGVSQMLARCPKAKLLGRATLRGYRWIISKRGFANVVVSADHTVEGVLYELTHTDENALDLAEGVAKGSYGKHNLPVAFGEKAATAMVYIDPVIEEGKPSDEYATRINLGVTDANLPTEYVTGHIRKFVPLSAGMLA